MELDLGTERQYLEGIGQASDIVVCLDGGTWTLVRDALDAEIRLGFNKVNGSLWVEHTRQGKARRCIVSLISKRQKREAYCALQEPFDGASVWCVLSLLFDPERFLLEKIDDYSELA
jgi:hypothetical protein